MPPTAPRHTPSRRLVVPVALLVLLSATACGTPPELQSSGRLPPPRPVTPTADPSAPGGTPPPGAAPGSPLPPGGLPGSPLPPGGLPGSPLSPGGLPGTPGTELPGGWPGSPAPGAPGVVPPGGLPGATTGPPPVGSGPTATACSNGPSASTVIALVRGRPRLLPTGARAKVQTGPLCADDWHWTMLDVTGHERLQVVTRGKPGAPELVTAGTDVCTAEVRATAPAGIRTLACDGVPAS
ncbi:hypothetical protein [Micromonospora rosaria]|uniref:hypothetical protein n=1 Tax=Micromonospora rosaria TaxID=47874 RepID=UPI0037CB056C